MPTIWVVVITIIILSIVIFFHELGHFAAAKACGVRVEDFSLGMGPILWKKRKGETLYSLRAFPIGGSCRMTGEDEESDDAKSFNSKKVWQRLTIVFAGPFMNFVLAMLIFASVFMVYGVPTEKAIVGRTLAGKAAETAGILARDEIVAINGQAVESWKEAVEIIRALPEGSTIFTVERKRATLDIVVATYIDPDTGYNMIGVEQGTEKGQFFTSIKYGIQYTYVFTKAILVALLQMITGQTKVDVAGPVGMAGMVGQVASAGLQPLLLFIGMLSVNLGLINLLPLPALDGSRMVFLTIEGVRGKPIDRRKEGLVHFTGLMLLFALMIFITYRDILRLIRG